MKMQYCPYCASAIERPEKRFRLLKGTALFCPVCKKRLRRIGKVLARHSEEPSVPSTAAAELYLTANNAKKVRLFKNQTVMVAKYGSDDAYPAVVTSVQEGTGLIADVTFFAADPLPCLGRSDRISVFNAEEEIAAGEIAEITADSDETLAPAESLPLPEFIPDPEPVISKPSISASVEFPAVSEPVIPASVEFPAVSEPVISASVEFPTVFAPPAAFTVPTPNIPERPVAPVPSPPTKNPQSGSNLDNFRLTEAELAEIISLIDNAV
ncbi:MAG: hypothetical protein LBQ48_03765 [Oscillospiraceae bacterium]|jgi:hypothetical protein|nr:hypothetical protein [Oscillospiraceae bacterium]